MTRKKETINGEGTNAPLSVQRLVNTITIDGRNNPSCVLTSTTPPPPPPNVSSSDLRCHRRHRYDRCVASRWRLHCQQFQHSSQGGRRGRRRPYVKRLMGSILPFLSSSLLTYWFLIIPPVITSAATKKTTHLPPLFCDRRCLPDGTTSPPLRCRAFGGWSEVGGVICVGNINEAYGKPYLSDTL